MNKLQLSWTYLAALWQLYYSAGGKLLPKEAIEERFAICQDCEHFTGRACGLCGCCTNQLRSHFNKIAFPTEHCPDNPAKW